MLNLYSHSLSSTFLYFVFFFFSFYFALTLYSVSLKKDINLREKLILKEKSEKSIKFCHGAMVCAVSHFWQPKTALTGYRLAQNDDKIIAM